MEACIANSPEIDELVQFLGDAIKSENTFDIFAPDINNAKQNIILTMKENLTTLLSKGYTTEQIKKHTSADLCITMRSKHFEIAVRLCEIFDLDFCVHGHELTHLMKQLPENSYEINEPLLDTMIKFLGKEQVKDIVCGFYEPVCIDNDYKKGLNNKRMLAQSFTQRFLKFICNPRFPTSKEFLIKLPGDDDHETSHDIGTHCGDELQYAFEKLNIPFELLIKDDYGTELLGFLKTILDNISTRHPEYGNPYMIDPKKLFDRHLIYEYIGEHAIRGDKFVKIMQKLMEVSAYKDFFDQTLLTDDIICLQSQAIWDKIIDEKKRGELRDKYDKMQLSKDSFLPKLLMESLSDGRHLHEAAPELTLRHTNKDQVTGYIKEYSHDILKDSQHMIRSTLQSNMIPEHLVYTRALRDFAQDMTGDAYPNKQEILQILHFLRPIILKYPYSYQQNLWEFFSLLKREKAYEALLHSTKYLEKCSKDARRYFVKSTIPVILQAAETVKDITSKSQFLETQIQLLSQRGIHIDDMKQYAQSIHETLKDMYSRYLGLQDINWITEDNENTNTLKQYFVHCNKPKDADEAPANNNYPLGFLLGLSKASKLKQFRSGDHSMIEGIMNNSAQENLQETPYMTLPENKIWSKIQGEYTTDYILSNTNDLGDRLFSIQSGLWDLLDPDNYEAGSIRQTVAREIYTTYDDIDFSDLENRALEICHKVKDTSSLPQHEFLIQLGQLDVNMPIIHHAKQISDLNIPAVVTQLRTNPDDIMAQQQANVIIDVIKEVVTGVQKQSTGPSLIGKRLEEIQGYISVDTENKSQSNAQRQICISHDMRKIITHIRGCLACTSKQSNNHRNIEFLYPNRFLILTDANGINLADQLVMLLPSNIGLLYAIDTLYGLRTKEVLLQHIIAVTKKIQHNQATEKIGIFIPNVSIKSAGASPMMFTKHLTKELGEKYIIQIHNDIECDMTLAGYNEFSKSKEGIIIQAK